MLEETQLRLASRSDEVWADGLLRKSPKCGVSSVRSDSLEHQEVVYLIIDAGERVGFLSYRKIGDQLFNFFVSPDHRRRGVGRRAVAKLFSEMRVGGAEKIIVNSVDEAVLFWEKTFHGFQVQMEGDNKFIVSIPFLI
ncbi:GNAT family N-acetyltransferase [Pseudomonas sivasensis]|uniref:GNAT family N-acetyltransferase n=1 Tax=Pseudomonas sivasensis TaxID=1880678 RepID=UPI003CFF3F1A